MGNEIQAPAYWWVNQGGTYDEEYSGGFIWAPKEGKAGRRFVHWDNVSKVNSGDYIFHYAKGALRALSKVTRGGYNSKKALVSTAWSDAGWRVDAEYFVLQTPVPIEKIGPKLASMQMSNGPINRVGGVNQGYLYELSHQAVQFLISRIHKDPAIEASGINQPSMSFESTDVNGDLVGLSAILLQNLERASVRSHKDLVTRFVAAALSKRFVILTGLAGSGKTKLAQAFAQWITPSIQANGDTGKYTVEKSAPFYALVPVGADWTGNENIVGYPDGLQSTHYIMKPALELILHANEPSSASIPHFLILDEMNLSHVERYFADLLSAIESGEEIPLYEGSARYAGEREIPRSLHLPHNLFIIGTVNVDETTYMFSPKVLDRANVIEFRMETSEMASFLSSPKAPRLEELDGKGVTYGREFVEAAADKSLQLVPAINAAYETEMLLFFTLLQQHNVEFGYRTAYEAGRLVHFYKLIGGYSDEDSQWFDNAMDAVIIQKLLPKLHGSRTKLEGLLWALAQACGAERNGAESFAKQLIEASKAEDDRFSPQTVEDALRAKNADDPKSAARYPLSFDKVMRMWRKLVRDQFVNFAEA